MNLINNIIIGAIIGIANIIPGVSGGTMIVMLGIYDKFIEEMAYCISEVKELFTFKKGKNFFKSIGTFFKNIFKREIKFLIPIFISVIISIYLLSMLFANMSESAQMYRNFVFTGLILGGVPFLIKELIEAKPGKKEKKLENGKTKKENYVLPFLITLIVMVVLYVLKSNGLMLKPVGDIQIDIWQVIVILFVGLISAFSMVIPGISGSMIIMILGYYDFMTKNISDLNFAFLIPFLIGIILGIVIATKTIKYLFDNYYISAYSGIIGFVLGSVLIILPEVMPQGLVPWIYAIIAIIIGVILAYGVEWYSNKMKKQEDKIKQNN